MTGYIWKEGTSPEDEAKGAYWERNMLALRYAFISNELQRLAFAAMHTSMPESLVCGWYYDDENNWDGWKRVISLEGGSLCFHVPDDFDLGSLPKIKPNWNKHSTREKWDRIAEQSGCYPIDWRQKNAE